MRLGAVVASGNAVVAGVLVGVVEDGKVGEVREAGADLAGNGLGNGALDAAIWRRGYAGH